jgi:hypothetical protein
MDFNPRELFDYDDSDLLREWYHEGHASTHPWANGEYNRHARGLLEVARRAAQYAAEQIASEPTPIYQPSPDSEPRG